MDDNTSETRSNDTQSGETGRGFDTTSRRGFLKAAAATGVATGLAGVSAGQDDGPLNPDETIKLGGKVEAWIGRDPQEIDGETNPTLDLAAGETYDLTWKNVDGLPHNFAIVDEEGETLRSTKIMSEQGKTQSVSFKATERMSEYLCEVHPTSMRGSIKTKKEEEEAVPEPAGALVPKGPKIGLKKVAGGPLQQPIAMAVDGTGRSFVADQTGEVYLMQDDGVGDEPFLDLSEKIVIQQAAKGGFARPEGFDERGLLGIAFHPNFKENRRFFVRYSGPPQTRELPEDYDHMAILSEFKASEDLSTADPESEKILLEVPEPQFNHNAGDISFGPDDLLYVTLGDGGGADDTGIGHVNDWYNENGGGNGQDITENLLGSILRIDVDPEEGQKTKTIAEKEFGIPNDNPLVGKEGRDEIYAWGFRNPWRMSFNKGELITADVGQNLFEEVDVVKKGGNYGWNVKEGFHCFSTEKPNEPNAIKQCPNKTPRGEPLIDPVLEYPHSVKNQIVGISVTGGFVSFNEQMPKLRGKYVFGDWSASFTKPAGRLWVADLPGVDFGAQMGTQTAQGNQTAGNQTVGNQTMGNETEMQGNQTAGNETDAQGTQTDQNVPQFPMQELVVAGTETGELGRVVLAFGRNRNQELFVLTSTTTTIQGNGQVFKIVPPGQGDKIEPVKKKTETPTGNETAGNETAGNQTVGNETAGNQTVGNETAGNETAGNETAGNETG